MLTEIGQKAKETSYVLGKMGTNLKNAGLLAAAQEILDEEKEEQAALRKQYVADIKASLRGHLNNISIVEKDGSVTDLGKKYGNVGNTES